MCVCVCKMRNLNMCFSFFNKDKNSSKNILQPCLIDAEPVVLGVPAIESALAEVGVRCCLLGVPFVERLSSCGTGVLGGLMGLDIVYKNCNDLLLKFRLSRESRLLGRNTRVTHVT